MSEKVNPIPDGFVGVVPHLVVAGAAKAIDFYVAALGAEELYRIETPGSDMLMHAEIKVGGNVVMLGEENPEWGSVSPASLGNTPVTLHLYVEDVDAALKRAEAAGGEVTMQPEDMFWGDRYAQFKDPFGHRWSLATHTRDVSQEEMAEAVKNFGKEGCG